MNSAAERCDACFFIILGLPVRALITSMLQSVSVKGLTRFAGTDFSTVWSGISMPRSPTSSNIYVTVNNPSLWREALSPMRWVVQAAAVSTAEIFVSRSAGCGCSSQISGISRRPAPLLRRGEGQAAKNQHLPHSDRREPGMKEDYERCLDRGSSSITKLSVL